jgi:hypothetical protein
MLGTGALLIGAIAWLGSGSATKRDAGGLAPSSQPNSTRAVPEKPAERADPSAAAQLTISLAAKPERAELRLDGRKVSNPYRAAHGRDNALHHLTASLAGYESVEEDLSFTKDLEIALVLNALTQPQKGRQSVTRTATARAGAQAARAASAVAADAEQPGDSLRGEKKSAKIDEADPYGR